MANTTNFGWETPDDTDLVKDGAAAMRTLGNSIDASFVDLKGGTTGQVLAKASNTDLDFTWSSVDPLTILDAKGDLITATAADTPARLASSGVNGDVLMVDTSTSTGLKWAAPAAGGMTLLSTTALSGSSTSITSISGSYNDLQIVISRLSTSSDAIITATFNSDTGTNYQLNSSGAASFPLSRGNTVDQISSASNNWIIDVFRYASSTEHKPVRVSTGYVNSSTGSQVTYADGGAWRNNAAMTSIQIACSAGTFDGGNVYIYGVK